MKRWRVVGVVVACVAACLAIGPAQSEGAEEHDALLTYWGGANLVVPAESDLRDEMAEVWELRQRREFVRVLDANDPGELREDATLNQVALDVRGLDLGGLFAFGDDLFELAFRPEDGLGNGLAGSETALAGDQPAPNYRRVQEGDFGGPDEYRCASCHSQGGLDGAGTSTQAALLGSDGDSTRLADTRSPPHVLGLGPVERLAAEMTAELHTLRDGALRAAEASGSAVRVPLSAKDIRFGALTALPDGTLDTTEVEGVSADLVVRPFGWKGHRATIRDMSREAFRAHMGVLSAFDEHLLREGLGDPALLGDGPDFDADDDGAGLELDDGMLTTMVAYLAQLEVPRVIVPTEPAALDAWTRGSHVFDEVGCATCHRRTLPLVDPRLTTRPDEPLYASSPPTTIDVATDGEHPKVERVFAVDPFWSVALFSDLKRHAMGESLASPRPFMGIAEDAFLTRPLWGLADTAPYMHDGGSPTVDDAIRRHGGEAAAASAAYAALSAEDRAALRVFLASLSRTRRLLLP